VSKLSTIEGIGPAVSDKLKAAGVRSVEALLKAGATSAGRRAISEKSGIDESRILKFVNHADLMRIRGVGGEYSELLEAAGVDSVPELAQRNADNLAQKMADMNARKKVVRVVPSSKSVKKWVSQAKQLRRVVSH
jgi:predicted flap endonuclease-1-like 5' DNA nuclease